MTFEPNRRGLLRGLAGLPLIGGSVTLIGQPTAAAVPVTPALLERYIAFLRHETAAAMVERYKVWREDGTVETDFHACRRELLVGGWSQGPDIEAMTIASKASTRAAIVLSAAGCPLFGEVA